MKKHWFTILILLIILLFAIFFAIIATSPKQDLQKRGFIPCTEALAENLYNCKNEKWCAVKAILNNTYCDLKVVAKGIDLWAKGSQPTPWSNYLFSPELYQDEEIKKFYQDNPNIDEEMNRLIELNTKLEKSTI